MYGPTIWVGPALDSHPLVDAMTEFINSYSWSSVKGQMFTISVILRDTANWVSVALLIDDKYRLYLCRITANSLRELSQRHANLLDIQSAGATPTSQTIIFAS